MWLSRLACRRMLSVALCMAGFRVTAGLRAMLDLQDTSGLQDPEVFRGPLRVLDTAELCDPGYPCAPACVFPPADFPNIGLPIAALLEMAGGALPTADEAHGLWARMAMFIRDGHIIRMRIRT